jgi:antitoxin ParD1/3/4
MATRNISLTDPLDRFIDDRVKTGDYQNASEVVRAALRLLKRQTDDEARKEARFQHLIQEGIDDIDAGRSEVITDLDAWFDALEAEVAAGRAAAE